MFTRALPVWLSTVLLACHGTSPAPVAKPSALPPAPVAPAVPRETALQAPEDADSSQLDLMHERRTPLLPVLAPAGTVSARAFPVSLARVGPFLRGEPQELGEGRLLVSEVPESQRGTLDLSPALSEGRGVVALVFGEQEPQLYVVSQLSALLKHDPRGAMVWVTRASDGAPVSGADVELERCEHRAKGKTDADGLVRFPSMPRQHNCAGVLALVRHGAEVTFVAQSYGGGADAVFMDADPDRTGEREGRVVGDAMVALFTERTWYRSGETIRFFGVARRIAHAAVKPLTGTMHVDVKYEEAKQARRFVVSVSADGMFSGELKAPGIEGVDHPVLRLAASQGARTLGTTRVIVGDVPRLTGAASPSATELDLSRFEPYVPRQGPFEPTERSLSVHMDRASYDAGDVARVAVASPFESAFALITLEREVLLDARVQKVEGARPVFEVPLGGALHPAAVLDITFSAAASPARDSFQASGSGYVSMAARHRLKVDAVAQHAGATGNVDVQVRDAAGTAQPSDLYVFGLDADMDFDLHRIDPHALLFERTNAVHTLAPHFAVTRVGCYVEGELMLPEHPLPSEADGTFAGVRLRTDAQGHATLALPARPGKRPYAVFVVAASRDGAVGFDVTPLVGM